MPKFDIEINQADENKIFATLSIMMRAFEPFFTIKLSSLWPHHLMLYN